MRYVGLTGTLVGIAMFSAPSMASTILSGSGAMTYSYQATVANPAETYSGNDYSLAVPGLYTFTDTFASQAAATTPLGTSTTVGAYDFQDSYRFSITSASAGDSLVASLGYGTLFQLTNLQVRLYQVSSTPGATTAPVVGGIPTGATMTKAWNGISGVVSAPNPVAFTDTFNNLQTGTYILDVAGISSGTLGAAYVGQLNLAPVPLPAAAWLLVSGLGGVGLFTRRRKTA
jgi:hypothetical protein